MTWIDWATVACVVYAALLLTLVAIRQQLRIKGDREFRGYQQRLRVDVNRVLECLYQDPGIQAGDPVYWDASGNPTPGRIFSGCVTPTPAEPKTPLHDVDVALNTVPDAAVLGVALADSQPVDPSKGT